MTQLFLLTLLLAETGPRVVLERVGRFEHEAIREASGMVKSRRHPDIFWVHNDSGNLPALFAVRRDGKLVREYRINVPNIDWEDITTDDKGHLYIGEIGNNGHLLALRGVYQIDEPDPFKGDRTVIEVNTASYYRFKVGERFDAEGLFFEGDRAIVVGKSFDRKPAVLYAIPFTPPSPLFRPAIPEQLGSLPGFTEPVTGADLSPDGRRLVVCSLTAVAVYQKNEKSGWDSLALRSFKVDDQIEAVAWDGDDILLAGEGRGIYLLRAANWRASPSGQTAR